jgi:Protein of unknown function (DUF1549)/Protein of unknown function (DUF1553)/Planctomycete cytochrome C
MTRLVPSAIVLFCLFASAHIAPAAKPAEPAPTKEGLDFFETQIRPILVHNCYECHSGDPKKAKGGLTLDTRDGLRKGGKSGAAINPGHPDQSLLIEAVQYESLEMPPKGKLPDELIDKLVQWVEMGAPDPRTGKAAQIKKTIDFIEARKFWAFQRPKAATPPGVNDPNWPLSDIDRFIVARQDAEHLHPVADADRVTWIRRVSFDLVGLPPAAEEIDAFVSDQSPEAFERVVDRLLASPQFGERWARHWLDIARFAESTGKGINLPYRYAWRYRDYVIDAFNADKPYDRFIMEQLAGDLLRPKDPAERNNMLVATGFLALGGKAINVTEEQFRYDMIDDQIDVTSRAFLGMTVACARCHDHKYDPIPTTDYYALAGIFGSTQTMAGVKPGRRVISEAKLLQLSEQRGSAKPSSEETARLSEMSRLEKELDTLKALIKPPDGRPRMPKARINPKVVRDRIQTIEKRLDELEGTPSTAGNLVMGVREGRAVNSPLLNRGELRDKGREVPRGVLTVLKTPQSRVDPGHSGRLALAVWIADKDNPLTARVMANRVWEHLFGSGLVGTVDNFGALGDEPTHPQLLDTLAYQFANDYHWSLKKLIRAIVLSRVYRLGSEHNSENYTHDPSNKYLWRMERRRLDAEEIRDSILVASGDLNLSRPEKSEMLELDNLAITPPKLLKNVRKPTNHRSIYMPILRGNVPEMLQVFDMADPDLIVGQRDVTTVAPQALFMMNNGFVLVHSNRLAGRVLSHRDLTQAGRIDLAYRFALGRLPTKKERSEVRQYLADYRKSVEQAGAKGNPLFAAWASFCQTLFASGEFRYVY